MNLTTISIRRLVLTFTALLASAAVPVLGEEKVLLKTQWKQGKTYTLSQKMDQGMSMGDKGSTDMKMDMAYGIKSSSAETDGDTKLAMHFEKMDMEMKMNMAGQEVVIDSKDETNPQAKAFRQQFAPILNAELVAVIGKDGELKDIGGLEALATPQMKQFFNKDMFSQTLSQDKMYGFPKTPVGAGESWKMDHEMDMMGMKMKMTGD
jgi:hypothetical protein